MTIPQGSAENPQVAPERAKVLDTAKQLVTGERAKDYGPPCENFERIARLWSVTLNIEVTPAQVALCLMQLKQARLMASPDHRDSWVDAAGYAGLGSEVAGCQETAARTAVIQGWNGREITVNLPSEMSPQGAQQAYDAIMRQQKARDDKGNFRHA